MPDGFPYRRIASSMIHRVSLRLSLLTVASIILPGCAISRIGSSRATNELPAQEFRGHYSVADGSWFTPCNGAVDERWWVTMTGLAVPDVDNAKREGRLTANAPVFVHWLAAQTTDGKVGPRGPGKPALLVREVRALRPARADDCE